MTDNDTTGVLRFVALLGLLTSFSVWAIGEYLGPRKGLVSLGAGVAFICPLVYFLGAMASADSGAHRFLPLFP